MDKPSLWMWAVVTGALCAGLTLVAARVHAQPQAEPAEYRALIDNAIAEYEARNFLEARALFARAHAAYPNARTLRGLGMAAFELREYLDSVTRLEEALASKVKPLDGDLRARTEELLARARSFITTVRLRVQPEHARVRLDGELVALGDSGTLRLGVGEHVLEVDASGFAGERKTLKVVGGDDRTLTIVLSSAVPTPAETARASAGSDDESRTAGRDEDDDGGVLSSPWFWTSAAVVVAGGVVAALLITGAEGEAEEPIKPRSGVTVGALRVAP